VAAVGPRGFNATSVVDSGASMLAASSAKPASSEAVVNEQGRFAVAPGKRSFFASADDGRTWRELQPAGLAATAVQALAVDPAARRL
jgi:hypothetical protein